MLTNWCSWIVVLEKTLESPLNFKEVKQVDPKQISPKYSLEELMLMMKLQHFGHLIWRTDSFEKTLVLGKTEGKRRGQQRMRWFDSMTDSRDINLNKLQEIVEDSGAWHASVYGVTNSWTWHSELINNSKRAINKTQKDNQDFLVYTVRKTIHKVKSLTEISCNRKTNSRAE